MANELVNQHNLQPVAVEQIELKLELAANEKIFSLLKPQEIYERLDAFVFAQLKEDRRIERKSVQTAARALGDYFSMWANTAPDGGLIFIGVENDGKITGCTSSEAGHLNNLEDSPRIYCSDARVDCKRVAVKNVNGQEDFVLVFRVSCRSDKVVKTSAGKAFIRSGDIKRELGDDEVREIQIAKGEVHHELESIALKYPEDFDGILLKEFAKNVKEIKGLKYAQSIGQILSQQKLGILRDKAFIPNNACCLLFAKDPILSFPGCKIRFMRFEGEEEKTGEEYSLIKDVTIEGPIPKMILQAEQVISGQLREYSALGKDGRFYAVPEYPLVAWYEAIVNACAHRSYNLKNMNIFVKMFDDKLVITSPGMLPPMVTPDNIYTMHSPRNPFLMEALRYFGFVKCANEGTRRMRDAMLQNKLPAPRFGETKSDGSGNVVVTFTNDYKQRRKFIDSKAAKNVVSEMMFRTLSQEDIRLVNYVTEHETINITQAARVLDREWGTAKKRLTSLVQKGVLHCKHRKDLLRDPKATYVLNKLPPKLS